MIRAVTDTRVLTTRTQAECGTRCDGVCISCSYVDKMRIHKAKKIAGASSHAIHMRISNAHVNGRNLNLNGVVSTLSSEKFSLPHRAYFFDSLSLFLTQGV